jgi:hypothetical protein
MELGLLALQQLLVFADLATHSVFMRVFMRVFIPVFSVRAFACVVMHMFMRMLCMCPAIFVHVYSCSCALVCSCVLVFMNVHARFCVFLRDWRGI